MKPSEFKEKWHDPTHRTVVFKQQILTGLLTPHVSCPLGCDPQKPLIYVNSGALEWPDHKGTHPQSTKCHWSGRLVEKDKIGDHDVTITLK